MRLLLVATLLAAVPAVAADVPVSTVEQLRTAMAAAAPGDTLVLADGTYDVATTLQATAEGEAARPIVVRAANRYGAVLRVRALVGVEVRGRHWQFDGLSIQGVCAVDADCEHAFLVSGHAEGFVLRHARVTDFNAQVVARALQNTGGTWEAPHGGRVEATELVDTRGRTVATPVVKLDVRAANGWVVRDNLIADFTKLQGDTLSFGAVMAGGGSGGIFERNRVLCLRSSVDPGGVRVGLSFGGAGTGGLSCAPAYNAGTLCDPEHSGGVARNNLVVNCSDVGVYVNRAGGTQLLFNTLVQTTGVDFRFPSSSGEAHGNLMGGVLRTRDGASLDAGTNLTGVSLTTFSGWYAAPLSGDLTVVGDVTSLLGAAERRALVTDDLCGRARPDAGNHTLGAVEHSLGSCDAGVGDGGADAGATDGGTDAGPTDGGGGSGVGGGAGGGGISVPPDDDGGSCGCGADGGGAALLGAALTAAWLRRRARAG